MDNNDDDIGDDDVIDYNTEDYDDIDDGDNNNDNEADNDDYDENVVFISGNRLLHSRIVTFIVTVPRSTFK